jgi:hypothetical protein
MAKDFANQHLAGQPSGTFPVYGLAAGTFIETVAGPRQIDTLTVGDRLTTQSGRATQIRSIGHCSFDPLNGRADRNLRPVRLSAGSLGLQAPFRDLIVAAGQHILLPNAGQPEEARFCDGLPEVRAVQYLQLEIETNDVILANGIWVKAICAADLQSQQYNGESELFTPVRQAAGL